MIPKIGLFDCGVLAGESGGSPIVDTRALYKAIDPEVREKFERLGVMYMYHNADKEDPHAFVPWQGSFHTDDRKVCEEQCEAAGFGYEWQPDGGLVRTVVSPPARPHHTTGEMCW